MGQGLADRLEVVRGHVGVLLGGARAAVSGHLLDLPDRAPELAEQVTHLHPEGKAGAVAVALAAAYAWGRRHASDTVSEAALLEFVEVRTPPGEVRLGLRQAIEMPAGTSVEHAASVLGSGYRISAQDTVPFCLWSASRFIDNNEDAMWSTVSALGDRETTCAIVCGIVMMSAGLESIPERWMASREGLPMAFKPAAN